MIYALLPLVTLRLKAAKKRMVMTLVRISHFKEYEES